jgi:sigma-B regulation protein RsbU (phosphoserine phosphatase)
MSNFQANFHVLINRHTNLEMFVRELNQALFRLTKGDRFLTFFVGLFCKETKDLYYINAGHTAPVLMMNGETQLLTKGCTILGSFEDLPFVETGQLKLTDDAFIITYTDGLTDVQNEQEEYFDENLLETFVKRNYEQPLPEFNKKLYDHIDQFRGAKPFPDDFTLLTGKIFS